MVFETFSEALANQALCGTCGRPKKALEGIYTGSNHRYQLVRCKEFRCNVHCSKKDGCSHNFL